MNINLVSENEWNYGYKDYEFQKMPDDYPVVKKIYEYLSKIDRKNVLEIGCFPGRFLYHFGKLGYELNGIDQTPYLKEMVSWLKKNQFKIGDFKQVDFNLVKYESYDVVFSSGFVEHFSNFEEIIKRHCKFVSDEGYIFITVPNFLGKIQNFLHNWLDHKNLNKHYIPSMDVEKWKDIVKQEGFEIISSGYIGGFDFWVGNEERPLLKRIIIKLISIFTPIRQIPDSRLYSPEIYLLAKKSNYGN